jgi:hypothetical protein
MQKAESLIESIEHYHSISQLPDFPDLEKTTQILVKIREKLYQ